MPRGLAFGALLLGLTVMSFATTSCDLGLIPCAVNDDCAQGSICLDGRCAATCNSDDECAEGTCAQGVCATGDPPAGGGGGLRTGRGADGGAALDEDGGGASADGGGDEDAGGDVDGGAQSTDDAGFVAPLDAGFIVGPDGGLTAADAGFSPADAGFPDAGFGGVDGGFTTDAGEVVVDAGPPKDAGNVYVDPCAATDPFGADLSGDCIADAIIGAPARDVAPLADGGPEIVGRLFAFRQLSTGSLDIGGTRITISGAPRDLMAASIAVEPVPRPDKRRGIYVGEPSPFSDQGAVYYFLPTLDLAQVTGGGLELRAGGTLYGASLAVARFDSSDPGVLLAGEPGAAGTPIDGRVEVRDGFEAGPDGGLLDLDQGDLTNTAGDGVIGDVVARGPDLDGDGLQDFIVRALGATQGATSIGALVVSSASRTFLPIAFELPAGSTSFGASIVDVGDVDGDGDGDIAFGAPADGAAGKVFVHLSSRAGEYLEVAPPPLVTAGARFGTAIAGVPDVDGDGRADIAIGAPLHSSGGGDVAACDDFGGAGYAGDCVGRVLLVSSALITTAVTVTAADCFPPKSPADLAQRMGAALRALGPSPRSGEERLLIGAPGTFDRSGRVMLFDVVWNAADGKCVAPILGTADYYDLKFNGAQPAGGAKVGEQFGATLGP